MHRNQQLFLPNETNPYDIVVGTAIRVPVFLRPLIIASFYVIVLIRLLFVSGLSTILEEVLN